MEIPNEYKIRKKILIEPDMFYSDAFKGLSSSAIRTLMRCLQKRKWEKTKIHGKKQIIYCDDGFIFPYAEATFLGVGTTQFWKNIIKLIDVGFLDLVHQGGWYQKNEKAKDYNVYKLSERWRKYDTSEYEMVTKPKVLREQFHIRENMKRQKLKVTSQKRSGQLHKSEGEKTKHENDRLHKSEVKEQAMESLQSFTATV